jgi:hypothetical protein
VFFPLHYIELPTTCCEFRAFTREFWRFTREFRAFTREFRCFTREFRAFTREFRRFTREFRAFTREYIFPTTEKKRSAIMALLFFEFKAIRLRPSSSGPLLLPLLGLH